MSERSLDYRAVPVSNDPGTGSLEQHLHRALGRVQPSAVRIVTAYLTPDGFLALRLGLQKAASVRLLLGEPPFINRRGPADILSEPPEYEDLKGPASSVDWFTFLEGGYPWLLLTREERKQLLERGEDASKLSFDLTAWERVFALVQFLRRDGVEVRRFLGSMAGKVPEGEVLDFHHAHARLHAKAYIFSGPSQCYAAVGSSNFTLGGLRGNIELNLGGDDPTLVPQLEDWFDGKWNQGQDCKGEFIGRLEDCVLFGRRYTPWQVFLKSLHAAYGHFLDLGLSEDIAERLARFQQQAVQRCVSLLERHWGVMLCDSVGLGKTFEGLGILGEFARRRDGHGRALVVCPAQLEGNWSQERFAQYGIAAETITMESLPAYAEIGDEPNAIRRSQLRARLAYWQNQFDIVLVDESHNFRNSSTKRYRALMELIQGGKPDKRVVLMTATPINNSLWDLYEQMCLITRGDDTWYAGRGPVTNLRSAFQAIEKGEGGAGLLDVMLLSLVRRTRHDIRAMQEAGEPIEVGGQPMRFPEHEIPKAVGYSLQNLYGEIYREVLDAVERLNFAVYQLESYGVDTGERDSEQRLRQRNANFVGIMRTILLKRMESSVTALSATVDAMVDYLELFLARLDAGKVLTPKQAQRVRAVLGGSLPDQDQDVDEWDPRAMDAVRELREAPPDATQRDRLWADVAADRDRLSALRMRLRWLQELWGDRGDPKVQELRKLLEALPAKDEHGIPTKVAIFTNYRDTARYIFRSLSGDPEALGADTYRLRSNLKGQQWISMLSGDDDRKRRAGVLERFAPLATHRDAEALDDPELQERIRPYRAEGIELLVTTDVLSEGQNLQDAQYLVNYDLHWNPVRMIQRAGRIDRLFSPHAKVYIYNIMPEQGLEDLLLIVKSLTRKLETIEDAVALDASVLGEQIEARQFDAIMKVRAGGAQADEVYREGERSQGLEAGLGLLNQYLEIMKQAATEEVGKIPDGVYSVKKGPQTGAYVMLRMPEEYSGEVFWRFYPLDDLGHPVESPQEVLGLIQAEREQLRLELPEGVNPFRYLREPLKAAVDQIGRAYGETVASQSPDRFLMNLQRLLQRDDLLSAEGKLWQTLYEWAKQPLPGDATRRGSMPDAVHAVNVVRNDAALGSIIEVLRRLWETIQAEGLDRPVSRPASVQPTVRDLELVAWELVVGPEGLAGAPPDSAQAP